MTKFDYEQQFSVEWRMYMNIEDIDILSPIEINPLHSRSMQLPIKKCSERHPAAMS